MAGETNQTDLRTAKLRVEGNVQGVGFRNWTQRLAVQLGLTGWVRNRRDGSVEIVVHGPVLAVEDAIARCKIGPRSAKVTALTVDETEIPDVEGFAVLPGI